MVPINNSDTAWLIVSDFNQDNDKHYEDLREDVLNPEINEWHWENEDVLGSKVGVRLCNIGGVSFERNGEVGIEYLPHPNPVFGHGGQVGGVINASQLVGSNYYGSD
jgi:hypothetical protein